MFSSVAHILSVCVDLVFQIGHRDLGKHLEATGDLQAASDAFIRMRPDASTQAHILDMTKHVISIMIQRRDWPCVLSNGNKMLSGTTGDEEQKSQQVYQKIVTGIANLCTEKFYDGARNFLEAGDPTLCSGFNNIVTPNDVATYGGLLALASMNRGELQTRVLENSSFRSYLELEPHLRKAVSMFVNGRYSACLATLEAYRTDYLLDTYLQKHVAAIYSQIRKKCIIQYFIPFSCVTLDSMKAAFAQPDKPLEPELIAMIKSGKLKARINTIDQLLVAVSTNNRVEMQRNALATAINYEREALERVRRMSIYAAELEVKGSRKLGTGGASDTWFDDPRRQGQGEASVV